MGEYPRGHAEGAVIRAGTLHGNGWAFRKENAGPSKRSQIPNPKKFSSRPNPNLALTRRMQYSIYDIALRRVRFWREIDFHATAISLNLKDQNQCAISVGDARELIRTGKNERRLFETNAFVLGRPRERGA